MLKMSELTLQPGSEIARAWRHVFAPRCNAYKVCWVISWTVIPSPLDCDEVYVGREAGTHRREMTGMAGFL